MQHIVGFLRSAAARVNDRFDAALLIEQYDFVIVTDNIVFGQVCDVICTMPYKCRRIGFERDGLHLCTAKNGRRFPMDRDRNIFGCNVIAATRQPERQTKVEPYFFHNGFGWGKRGTCFILVDYRAVHALFPSG